MCNREPRTRWFIKRNLVVSKRLAMSDVNETLHFIFPLFDGKDRVVGACVSFRRNLEDQRFSRIDPRPRASQRESARVKYMGIIYGFFHCLFGFETSRMCRTRTKERIDRFDGTCDRREYRIEETFITSSCVYFNRFSLSLSLSLSLSFAKRFDTYMCYDYLW